MNAKRMDPRPDYEIAREELSALMERERLDVVAVFVPFSQSRNKDETDDRGNPRLSLNWSVTLQRQGRDANTGEKVGPVYEIVTTDYSAGIAHCPAYKATPPAGYLPREVERFKRANIAKECETGRRVVSQFRQGPAIMPDPVDVFSSLAMDSGVLDAGSFENWAADYGYDTDSRAAEATYRACLDIALKLRAALGDPILTEAREIAHRL